MLHVINESYINIPRPIKNIYSEKIKLAPEFQKALEYLRGLDGADSKKAVRLTVDSRALGASCRVAIPEEAKSLTDIDLGLYLLEGLAVRSVLVVEGVPDAFSRVPIRLLSESAARIAAFRRTQRALGRKQVELWLTEKEKASVLALVAQMREEQ